jgi:four helix bundle protein
MRLRRDEAAPTRYFALWLAHLRSAPRFSRFSDSLVIFCSHEEFVAVEREKTVKHKSVEFAKRIVRLYKHMSEGKKEFILSKQLLRSGTSIGANITEAECGASRKDFLSKMNIAYKECAETSYWLELLHSSGYLTNKEYDSIKTDCNELLKMLAAITKTTKASLQEANHQ